MKKPQILVVGSCVMDLVTRLKKIPGSGETVLGEHFTTASGGKGANQAVQAARLGACVTMVGKVGDDAFGREMRSSLAASGVDVTYLMTQPDQASGVGNILLETGSNGASQNLSLIHIFPFCWTLRGSCCGMVWKAVQPLPNPIGRNCFSCWGRKWSSKNCPGHLNSSGADMG